MARPLRIQYPGAVYHVTNRGNERKIIFKDDTDRVQFLQLLANSVETYDIMLHCFAMMNNHFHLLAETPLGNLGEFMRHFNITYTSAAISIREDTKAFWSKKRRICPSAAATSTSILPRSAL